MSEQDRANRLRRRRRQVKERAESSPDETAERTESDEASATAELSEPSKPGETNNTAETSEIPESGETDETDERSVKDEQVGTYMYLPRRQKREIERRYKLLSAEYEYEFEEDFEKNRHFYPLLVQLGLDRLADVDVEELRTLVDEVRQVE
jgi:hypothetical protein